MKILGSAAMMEFVIMYLVFKFHATGKCANTSDDIANALTFNFNHFSYETNNIVSSQPIFVYIELIVINNI